MIEVQRQIYIFIEYPNMKEITNLHLVASTTLISKLNQVVLEILRQILLES